MSRAGGRVPDDVTAAVLTLQRRFPGSSVWFGSHTLRWWAVMPCTAWWVLIEAPSPTQLAEKMTEALGTGVPHGVIGPINARIRGNVPQSRVELGRRAVPD